jgi:hypothetical protein
VCDDGEKSEVILQTNNSSASGHPEVSIAFDPNIVISADADWLINYIESDIRGGKRFEENSTIQIGWMICRFQKFNNILRLCEPDFRIIPIQFVDSVNLTLFHLRRQRDVCDSLGVARHEFPSILESALSCSEMLNSNELLLERASPQGRDSGWFVGCTNSSHDHNDTANLRRTSLYEIACAKPSVIEFFALPSGSRVITNKHLRVWLDGHEASIVTGSYLHNKTFSV